MTTTLSSIIESNFIDINTLNKENASLELKQSVETILNELNTGKLRVSEKKENEWITHEWIKKAILLSFKLNENQIFYDGTSHYFDKIPLKYAHTTSEEFTLAQTRVVPSATVRYGAFVGAKTIIMPSFVNIGAYVDEGCMIDTWVTVGSCAQIGKNVHLSGGVGIGGVLEPLQANPTIIEDNVFIGARSEIVEGVIVEKNSVLSMGVFIGKSTKIYHRQTGEIFYGKVPEGSVVVPGSLLAEDGSHSLYCAVIVKQVDEKTRNKTSINELLRSH